MADTAKPKSTKSKASPKAVADLDPPALGTEPAAGVVANGGTATSSAPGGAGGAFSSEVSTANGLTGSAADGLMAGASQDALMPAAPGTAAGMNTGSADGDGPQMGATEGHEQTGGVAASSPVAPSAASTDVAEAGLVPAEPSWADLQRDDDEPNHQFVVFDITHTPTEDERAAFKLLLIHMRKHGVLPELVSISVNGGTDEEQKMLAEALASIGIEHMPLGYPATAIALADISVVDRPALMDAPLSTKAVAAGDPWRLRIRAKAEGFRRCGISHSKEIREHTLSDFTSDEIETLLAEPNLTVELV